MEVDRRAACMGFAVPFTRNSVWSPRSVDDTSSPPGKSMNSSRFSEPTSLT